MSRNATQDERAMWRRYLGEIPAGTTDADIIRGCKAIVAARRYQAGKTAEAVNHVPPERFKGEARRRAL